MFTFSFECQQRGSLPEAPVRAGGPGRVVFPLSCPHLHPGERSTSQGRWVPQSCHYRCLTERVWHFFFYLFAYKLHLLALSRLPCLTHPASSPLTPRSQGIFIFGVRRLFLPEKGKSWKRFKNSDLSLTFFFKPFASSSSEFLSMNFFFCVYKIKTKGKK